VAVRTISVPCPFASVASLEGDSGVGQLARAYETVSRLVSPLCAQTNFPLDRGLTARLTPSAALRLLRLPLRSSCSTGKLQLRLRHSLLRPGLNLFRPMGWKVGDSRHDRICNRKYALGAAPVCRAVLWESGETCGVPTRSVA